MSTIKGEVPVFGQGMDEGLLTMILVEAGNPVERGMPLAEVETAKSTIEIVAEASGTLTEWLAEKGTILISGDPLYVIESTD